MHKTIKITMWTVCTILLFSLLYHVYLYFVPRIQVIESVAQSEDFYMELPIVMFEKESVFGVRKDVQEQVATFTNEIALFQTKIGTKYSKPMNICCEITSKGNQVKVVFSGTVTRNDGQEITVNNEFRFDKY